LNTFPKTSILALIEFDQMQSPWSREAEMTSALTEDTRSSAHRPGSWHLALNNACTITLLTVFRKSIYLCHNRYCFLGRLSSSIYKASRSMNITDLTAFGYMPFVLAKGISFRALGNFHTGGGKGSAKGSKNKNGELHIGNLIGDRVWKGNGFRRCV
jgi:hypothetical protein